MERQAQQKNSDGDTMLFEEQDRSIKLEPLDENDVEFSQPDEKDGRIQALEEEVDVKNRQIIALEERVEELTSMVISFKSKLCISMHCTLQLFLIVDS